MLIEYRAECCLIMLVGGERSVTMRVAWETPPSAANKLEPVQSGSSEQAQGGSKGAKGGLRLDKTPTDDEITQLWEKVRSCLDRTPYSQPNSAVTVSSQTNSSNAAANIQSYLPRSGVTNGNLLQSGGGAISSYKPNNQMIDTRGAHGASNEHAVGGESGQKSTAIGQGVSGKAGASVHVLDGRAVSDLGLKRGTNGGAEGYMGRAGYASRPAAALPRYAGNGLTNGHTGGSNGYSGVRYGAQAEEGSGSAITNLGTFADERVESGSVGGASRVMSAYANNYMGSMLPSAHTGGQAARFTPSPAPRPPSALTTVLRPRRVTMDMLADYGRAASARQQDVPPPGGRGAGGVAPQASTYLPMNVGLRRLERARPSSAAVANDYTRSECCHDPCFALHTVGHSLCYASSTL